VLEALTVQPLGFCRDPLHLGGGQEAANDAEAFRAQLPDDVLHLPLSALVAGREITTSANSTP